MTIGWWQLLLAGIALAACTIGSSARADVIDGNWCGPDGRVFTITGPRIVTPAGTATTGDYSRHSFAYVVPASDPGAGLRITMQLFVQGRQFGIECINRLSGRCRLRPYCSGWAREHGQKHHTGESLSSHRSRS